MPVYEYKCPACERSFEISHAMDDHSPRACLDCAKPLQRVFRLGGVSFKGKGWGKDR